MTLEICAGPGSPRRRLSIARPHAGAREPWLVPYLAVRRSRCGHPMIALPDDTVADLTRLARLEPIFPL